MKNAIEVRELSKDYKGFSLRDVSFSLPAGYIMGLVGENGAGKTTTIRLLLNMVRRTAGTVKIFGLDNIEDEQRIKQDIAVVLDDIYFVDSWRVAEVETALKGFYTNWNSEKYGQYVKSFRLPLDKQVKDLSRGMKLKLMLAVALSHEAKLLILDEPTSGIDPVARNELLGILSTYISDGERSILFSTHITTDLEKIADYITLIRRGRIFYTGTKDDLLESFYTVKGGPDDLKSPLRERIIGLYTSNTGFAGLLPASDLAYAPKGVVTETPTIDEILVCISKEA
ncbi:MAG TPA: ABC transporter ATP-binding protein [Bacillota bacterium]|jgi:ABC-2 type transport system ATP-binding protein